VSIIRSSHPVLFAPVCVPWHLGYRCLLYNEEEVLLFTVHEFLVVILMIVTVPN
jgi:hypothetical protein